MLRNEIIRRNLQKNVRFLGMLVAEEMRDRYLKSHVFVSASTIENSPNSVGEAMILGVPVVASDVGGVSSMLINWKEGLLYPFNEYAVLAENVCKFFRDNDLSISISMAERERALQTHAREENYSVLLSHYKKINR